ncbi:MAG: LEA type 2 family protein [Syntrophales bacterium]|nr:LEA type 2 family protein [Syntrophales bacterium]MDD5233280.1 LEA type 2 family protein [Syntrophales bacterium]MDD5532235.1 LEA type 2 family protein [Syntrophales bacterium]HPL63100.1 LEA type 2 family protein [Syntrophales bacterium]
MKDGLISGFFVIVLSLILLGTVSCLGRMIEKPVIEIREIAVEQVSLTDLKIVLGLDVRNPNRFALELKSLEFSFQLDEKDAGRGRTVEELRIEKSSAARVSVPIVVSYGDVIPHLKLIFSGKEAPYKLEGKAHVKTFLGAADIPFRNEGRIGFNKK